MTTQEDSIQQKVQALILEILPDVNVEDLSEDDDIFSMGLDSINAMTLVTNLQETFGIQFDSQEINFENFQNIKSIAEFIGTKQEQ